MKRGFFFAATVTLALGTSGRAAHAAPMSTDLATVRSDAVTVVTGKVRWVPGPVAASGMPSYTLQIDVDGTLRGTAPPTMTVDESPDGHVFVPNERVVAFVNAHNQLQWVATKIAGPDLEHGVLELQGFFDFNAHLVHPGMMTLAQLKSYLAGGALKNTFSASIAFPDGSGGFRATSRHLTLDWDPVARTGAVSGLSPACLSFSTVFGLEWGKVELRFSDTCNTAGGAYRELSLDGKPTGVDASGNITVDLVPTEPLLLEPEFDAFVADGHIASVTRVVRVKVAGGDWSWRIRDGLVDPFGKKRAPGGMGSSMGDKMVGGVQVSTYQQYWEFGDATVRLSRSAPSGTSISSIGTDSELLAAVDAGGWSCSLERKGMAAVPCTLKQDPGVVVRR